MKFVKREKIIQIRTDWQGFLRKECFFFFFSLSFERKEGSKHLKLGK